MLNPYRIVLTKDLEQDLHAGDILTVVDWEDGCRICYRFIDKKLYKIRADELDSAYKTY